MVPRDAQAEDLDPKAANLAPDGVLRLEEEGAHHNQVNPEADRKQRVQVVKYIGERELDP